MIQLLPARQRAAIILRDVLEWPVPDIAALLELSPAAVNSALQRGRATLRSQLPQSERETWAAEASNQAEREVLDAYIAAYETGDEDATFALLTDDIRVTMPPAPYLFEGLADLRRLVDRARDTGTWRLLPTWANRQPAAACYLLDPASGEFRAFKLDVLRLAGEDRRDHHVRLQALPGLRPGGGAAMTIPVTLLGRTIPDTMERAVHVLRPGWSMTAGDEAWHQALAVVEHGGIEIRTVRRPGPARRGRLVLRSRVRDVDHQSGDLPAVVATVRHVPSAPTSPDAAVDLIIATPTQP